MKTYFFLSFLCFLFGSQAAFSASSPYSDLSTPSVEFSRNAANQLFGGGKKGIFNCPVLLSQEWAYSNAQVIGLCNEAETACLRYGLIAKRIKAQKGNLEALNKIFLEVQQDVGLKLRGCQLAIEATLGNGLPIGKAAGF